MAMLTRNRKFIDLEPEEGDEDRPPETEIGFESSMPVTFRCGCVLEAPLEHHTPVQFGRCLIEGGAFI